MDLVPEVDFNLPNFEHQTILDSLQKFASNSKVALTDSALGKSEGVVLRNRDRSKIVKLRFEDYLRTLKVK